MRPIWALCFSGTLALELGAQAPTSAPSPPPASVARAEMKKLDAVVGQWTGESWIELGDERRASSVTETATWKQNGLLVVIEGVGRRKTARGSEEEGPIVHDALGVLFYDAAAKRYLFHAYRDGNFVESEWKATDRGYEWGFREPRANATVRFTIDLSNRDRWVETGEISRDGTSWRTFFQMNLQRTR